MSDYDAGWVRISRVTTFDGEEIQVEIADGPSGSLVRATISMEDFARAVTGMSAPVKGSVGIRTERWGMKALYERRSVSAAEVAGGPRGEWTAKVAEAACPDGYELLLGSFNNRGYYDMTFARWVPADSGQGEG